VPAREVTAADVAAYYDAKDDDVFARAGRERARPVHQLSASGVGRCLKRGAYQVAGTPTDPGWEEPPPSRAAMAGEAWHEWYLHRLAAECAPVADERIEQPTRIKAAGIELPGRWDFYDVDAQYVHPDDRADLSSVRYDPDHPLGAVMYDLKTVGAWKWGQVLEHGLPYEHWIQGLLYAVGEIQRGGQVDWLVWHYVSRDKGEKHYIVRRYTPQRGAEAIARVEAIVRAAANPDLARREERGPSAGTKMSFSPCDSCPWLDQCWPTAAGRARQAAAVAELPGGAAEAVASYAKARAVKSAAEGDQDFFKLLLDGVEPGEVYPDPDGERAWKYSRTRTGSVSVRATKRPPEHAGKTTG
jgi:hypothetical protein